MALLSELMADSTGLLADTDRGLANANGRLPNTNGGAADVADRAVVQVNGWVCADRAAMSGVAVDVAMSARIPERKTVTVTVTITVIRIIGVGVCDGSFGCWNGNVHWLGLDGLSLGKSTAGVWDPMAIFVDLPFAVAPEDAGLANDFVGGGGRHRENESGEKKDWEKSSVDHNDRSGSVWFF